MQSSMQGNIQSMDNPGRPSLVRQLRLKLLLGGLMLGGSIAGFALTPSYAEQTSDPEKPGPMKLLNMMSEALKNTTYRGTFVHIVNGHVESMQLLHAVENGAMRERMTSLNGEAREVYRNDSRVTCIWPGSRSVIVSKSKPRDLLPQISASLTSSDAYQFVAEADDRVAGKASYVVSVNPRDHYRYGYRFWIDKQSYVMLRSMLLDRDQVSLEQVMFTEISYPEKIATAELEANAEARGGYTWVESADKPAASAVDRVSFSSLPAGYQEMSETYDAMPMSDSAVSHVMVSDGLASVSVYVEYSDTTAAAEAESGMSKMGALNAYARRSDNAFVTVVGEVPAATVKAIGDAVMLVAAQ